MPGTVKRIRAGQWRTRTPRDAGETLTIEITRYDTGMIKVQGNPINQRVPEGGYDEAGGRSGAIAVVVDTIVQFFDDLARERRQSN